MTIDEKYFFREATLRICGNLNIEIALWQCFLFLKEIFPLDLMFLNIFEPGLGIVETIARADFNGGEIVSLKTVIPETSHPAILKFMDYPGKEPFIYTVPRLRDHITGGHIAATMGVSDSGGLIMCPKLTGQMLGGVVLTNKAGQAYSEEHIRLLSLLNEPFGIAISNYSRFREISRLKDLLEEENRYLSENLRNQTDEEIIGDNFGLKNVMDLVRQVASLSSPVLLLGETGTGKELIANAIHRWSPRREEPFIKVNCGAIPESLIDSELFGHEKGAFTGALSQRRGRFERAHTGTIFLDEIGDLPAGAQIRLLRVLQEKELERVGGSEAIKVDIRVIAATHRNLESMLADGRFREDLYFRIRVFPISIPPLRDRLSDIPALVHHFIQKKAREMALAQIPVLAPDALSILLSYSWPGNVRELQNVIERELIVSHGQPLAFRNLRRPDPKSMVQLAQPPDSAYGSLNSLITNHIMKTLEMTGGKVEGPKGAARLLDINPSTLRKKIRKLGIPYGRQIKVR
jgi:transcriptional regulator with GAF, ATPase, and Fis domain